MNHCSDLTSRDMRWKKLILVEVTAALTSDTERSQENRSKNDKYKAGLVPSTLLRPVLNVMKG